MTNLDKLRAVEISGATPFAHCDLWGALGIMMSIRCEDCPIESACENHHRCGEQLMKWLDEEAAE